MKKNSFLLILVISLFITSDVFALTIDSSYRDVTPSSQQSTNLLALAQNYDSFKESDFVIFSDSQYSYYIVWSKDLKLINGNIKGTDIEYIHYYRESDYNYAYFYSTDSSFNFTGSHLSVSSIDGYGFTSLSSLEYDYYLRNEKYLTIYEQYSVLLLALIFGIFLLRGGHF